MYQTKQAIAYNLLRSRILSGEAEPGSRLVIDQIARQLKISPIPVREAVKQLESERLIVFTPHSGAVVAEAPDPEEVFTLLESLETIVAAAAAEKAEESDCAQLDELIEQLESARKAGDLTRWLALNTHFHEMLATIADMPLAADLLSRANREWERLRLITPARRAQIDLAAADDDHQAMVACLRKRDGGALKKLVQSHLASARAYFVKHSHTKKP